MAKFPWYLKAIGKPYIKNGKLIQELKIHPLWYLYNRIKYLLNNFSPKESV